MKLRSSFVFAVVAAMAFAVGCQSAPMGESAKSMSSSQPPTKAVLITSGQGSTIVYLPRPDGTTAMLASGKMEKCAQCEADVASYFKTGEIYPKCAVCGATRTPISGTN